MVQTQNKRARAKSPSRINFLQDIIKPLERPQGLLQEGGLLAFFSLDPELAVHTIGPDAISWRFPDNLFSVRPRTLRLHPKFLS
jgi:hypothetical protein